jgi:hypothetical protein
MTFCGLLKVSGTSSDACHGAAKKYLTSSIDSAKNTVVPLIRQSSWTHFIALIPLQRKLHEAIVRSRLALENRRGAAGAVGETAHRATVKEYLTVHQEDSRPAGRRQKAETAAEARYLDDLRASAKTLEAERKEPPAAKKRQVKRHQRKPERRPDAEDTP